MKAKRGFTLIELLIVIALLGALAVGLIGAIDPFEQLKKGSDTGTRDIVNQVQTAIIRYYSVKNAFPWTGAITAENLSSATMTTAISNMVDAGELKSDFMTIQANKLGQVFVSGDSTTYTAVACYKPTSKSFRVDANTKFSQAGVLRTDCISQTGGTATDCYWCIQ